MNNKSFSLFITIGLLFLTGCSLFGSQPDNTAQIHALETQNALLAQQIEVIQQQNQAGSNRDDTTVPQPAESSGLQIEQSPKEPEQLPTEPVKSGVPIEYEGWRLTVSSEIETDSGDRLFLQVYLENTTDYKRIFRFTNAAISISDDVGTDYPAFTTGYAFYTKYDCEPYYHKVKNLEVRSESTVKIDSSISGCESSDNFGSYHGPIPLNADQIYVHFNDFGPFTGITVVIDL